MEQGKNEFTCEIFLTNLGKYVEGSLEGEWVKLPIGKDEMQEVYRKIGIDGERYSEVFITDYDFSINEIPIGEYANISELNYLADILKGMDDYDRSRFENALILEGGCAEVADLINLTENLDCYEFFEGITCDREYGDYLVYECDIFDGKIPAELQMYIDTEALGRDTAINDGGYYSSKGYIIRNQNTYQEIYTGEQLPDKYKISPAIVNGTKNTGLEEKSVMQKLASYQEKANAIGNENAKEQQNGGMDKLNNMEL